MRQQALRGFCTVSMAVCFFGVACSSSAPNRPAAGASSLIPPESPLAKVTVGMGTTQVATILGQPSDHAIGTTGKQWNPFYFGNDVVRTTYYYKGVGRIVISSSDRVMEIHYDPSEDGFK